MRRALALAFVVVLAACALAPRARAGDVVDADTFSLRVPAGFEPLDLGALEGGADAERGFQMIEQMTNGAMKMEARVFGRMAGSEPEALLMVASMEIPEEIAKQMKGGPSLDQMQAQIERGLEMAEQQTGIRLGSSRVSRGRIASGHEVLEMTLAAEDPEKGEMVTARMLMAIGDGVFLVAGLEGYSRNDAMDDPAWRSVVASLELDDRSALVKFAFRYGPYVLIALALFVGFVLFRRAGESPGAVATVGAYTATTGEAAADGALSRAMDGLPLFGGGPRPAAPAPLSTPGGGGRPGLRPPRIPRASGAAGAATPAPAAPAAPTATDGRGAVRPPRIPRVRPPEPDVGVAPASAPAAASAAEVPPPLGELEPFSPPPPLGELEPFSPPPPLGAPESLGRCAPLGVSEPLGSSEPVVAPGPLDPSPLGLGADPVAATGPQRGGYGQGEVLDPPPAPAAPSALDAFLRPPALEQPLVADAAAVPPDLPTNVAQRAGEPPVPGPARRPGAATVSGDAAQ